MSRAEVAYLLEQVEAAAAAIIDDPVVPRDTVALARRATTLDALAAATVRRQVVLVVD